MVSRVGTNFVDNFLATSNDHYHEGKYLGKYSDDWM